MLSDQLQKIQMVVIDEFSSHLTGPGTKLVDDQGVLVQEAQYLQDTVRIVLHLARQFLQHYLQGLQDAEHFLERHHSRQVVQKLLRPDQLTRRVIQAQLKLHELAFQVGRVEVVDHVAVSVVRVASVRVELVELGENAIEEQVEEIVELVLLAGREELNDGAAFVGLGVAAGRVRRLMRVKFAINDAHEDGQQLQAVVGMNDATRFVQTEDNELVPKVLAFQHLLQMLPFQMVKLGHHCGHFSLPKLRGTCLLVRANEGVIVSVNTIEGSFLDRCIMVA